jgi:hypothetical protein
VRQRRQGQSNLIVRYVLCKSKGAQPRWKLAGVILRLSPFP